MSSDRDYIKMLHTEISNIIDEHMPKNILFTLGLSQVDLEWIFEQSLRLSLEDLMAFFENDPEMKDKVETELGTYLALKAVMAYRVANVFYNFKNYNYEKIESIFHHRAFRIAEISKRETSVYIHPAAKIGKKLTIEYGTSTVIGEDVEMGERCYIHHGVILGSIPINPKDGGHPTIGNNVCIGGCARILGPVKIGDNVLISPYCVVTENVPSNCEVLIVNQLQLLKHKRENDPDKINIFGIVPDTDGIFTIYGSNLKDLNIQILTSQIHNLDTDPDNNQTIKVSKLEEGTNFIKLQISLNEEVPYNTVSIEKRDHIYIFLRNKSTTCVTKSFGFLQVLDSILN